MSRWMEGIDEWEVFVQFGAGKDVVHVGSVRAAEASIAWHVAREIYTRRERATRLWVVPRARIYASEGEDAVLLSGQSTKTFRLPAFPGRHRRARSERLAPVASQGEE